MAGGGVGEAMLIGAAVGATAGGAGAAIQGGDPMKGALVGGAMGAVGGGIGGAAAAPAATTATGVTAGSGAGVAAGGGAGLTAGGAGGGTFGAMGGAAAPAGIATTQTAAGLGSSISGVGAGSGALGSAGFGAGAGGAGYGAMGGAGSSAGIAGTQAAAGVGGGASGAGTGAATNVFGQVAGTPGYLSNTQLGMTGATAGLAGAMQAERAMYGTPPTEEYDGPLSKLKYDPDKFTASTPQYAPTSVYRPTYAAEGGIMQAYRDGNAGAVADYDDESGSDNFRSGGIARFAPGGMAFTGIPGGMPSGGGYQTTPDSLTPSGLEALMGNKKKRLTQEELDSSKMQGLTPRAYLDVYGEGMKAQQQMAKGGHLGGYSDGGRMLKGPGDGMSDNIPATIAGKQPARLADGEFVVPADVVSHLGNGSTDAGAKQLYSMMDRVRKARTGNKKQGKQIKPNKYMVA